MVRVSLVLLLLATAARADRTHENSSCEGCHTDIAVEWRASLHRQAWTDPVFLRAFAIEPMEFCRGCHAPEGDPRRDPPRAVAHLGVGCVTCHVRGAEIASAHPAKDALHPLLVDATLATAAACASCHEFDFPPESHQLSPQPMQDTVAEHARSSATEPCQACHMPIVDGPEGRHRSHAFRVLGDAQMIRSAARVTAERVGDRDAAITIAPAGAGHAFPTGDLFRRLVVRAEAQDGSGHRLGRAREAVLARTFADVPRSPHSSDLAFERIEASDTRVPPPGAGPPARVELHLQQAGPASRIRWRVLYQRMSTPMASAFRLSQVLDEIEVAAGELDPLPLSQRGGPR